MVRISGPGSSVNQHTEPADGPLGSSVKTRRLTNQCSSSFLVAESSQSVGLFLKNCHSIAMYARLDEQGNEVRAKMRQYARPVHLRGKWSEKDLQERDSLNRRGEATGRKSRFNSGMVIIHNVERKSTGGDPSIRV